MLNTTLMWKIHRGVLFVFSNCIGVVALTNPRGILRPLSKPTQHCWYSREPLGHNTLANVVSSMCKEAGITGFYTNHTLRATSATRLYSAGADEQLIMERTGHRSVGGVHSYKRTSEEQQQVISDILGRIMYLRQLQLKLLQKHQLLHPFFPVLFST